MTMISLPQNGVGVYPDGSPVVYNPDKAQQSENKRLTPQEAADKRNEIAEKLAAEQPDGKKPMFISFTPELENPDAMPPVPPMGLERTPDADTTDFHPADNTELKQVCDAKALKGVKIPPETKEKITDKAKKFIKTRIRKLLISILTPDPEKAQQTDNEQDADAGREVDVAA